MLEHKESRTARLTASYRAAESRKPAEARVCFDPFADRFLARDGVQVGMRTRFAIAKTVWFHNILSRGFGSIFCARTRHIDECLQAQLRTGLDQLVILGAGHDSRAYRIEALKERTRVFEVDHPATQAVKQKRVTELLGELPGHVTYVPVDFEKESLAQRLAESGYSEDAKTFFLWEGVTFYLTEKAVNETLAFVAQHSKQGSTIVFDYTQPDVVAGTTPHFEGKMWQMGVKDYGEPLTFGVEDEKIVDFLTERGFTEVEPVGTEKLKQLYFTGVNAKRYITPVIKLVQATVGAK